MAKGDDSSDESRRILDRVSKESEAGSRSYVARKADRVRDHMTAADADQADAIEVWGTRIGRVLGLVLFVVLVGWLLLTLLRGG